MKINSLRNSLLERNEDNVEYSPNRIKEYSLAPIKIADKEVFTSKQIIHDANNENSTVESGSIPPVKYTQPNNSNLSATFQLENKPTDNVPTDPINVSSSAADKERFPSTKKAVYKSSNENTNPFTNQYSHSDIHLGNSSIRMNSPLRMRNEETFENGDT